jgi:periplasmic divalent cation tolerance protein
MEVMKMEEYIQVVTAIEKREEAEKIADFLVEKRLAACVQIVGPIVSTYWWKGNIERAKEWLCIIKSKKDLYEELEKSIKEIH